MQKSLLFKTFIVCGLMLVIGIPLMMIQSTIAERISFRDEAVRSIAADSVREQTMIGPILVLPYTDEYEEQEAVFEGKSKKTKTIQRSYNKRMLVYPNDMQIQGVIDTDRRYRGIHKVLVYSGQYLITGDFVLPKKDDLPHGAANSRITLDKPFVALSVEDPRGIRSNPKMTWDGKPFEFEQGSGLIAFTTGLHATLDSPAMKEPASVKFSIDLGLDGIERQHIVPLAKNNQVNLKSNWPHPQFGGRFLPSPKDRTINESGFSAAWSISALATNAEQQMTRLEQTNKPSDNTVPGTAQSADLDRFSVSFIEPINIYSQSDRATKYGLLFVALTFAAFFVFEILKRLPIHPVQYLLVGLALVLFFLLLLSLSEHIEFILAYMIASTACIVLIGFYLAHVLHDRRRGFGFGCALTLLYGALYGLLSSENNALVLGSILLFAVLAAIMIATRKVDWYQIGKMNMTPAS